MQLSANILQKKILTKLYNISSIDTDNLVAV